MRSTNPISHSVKYEGSEHAITGLKKEVFKSRPPSISLNYRSSMASCLGMATRVSVDTNCEMPKANFSASFSFAASNTTTVSKRPRVQYQFRIFIPLFLKLRHFFGGVPSHCQTTSTHCRNVRSFTFKTKCNSFSVAAIKQWLFYVLKEEDSAMCNLMSSFARKFS